MHRASGPAQMGGLEEVLPPKPVLERISLLIPETV